jgi:fructose-1,6-bisphosphatase/inositol monophosphatase family enzyme
VDDLSLAAELVRDAGTLAAAMLAEGLETRYKTSISDVVSAADEAAERLIAGRLVTERPDDGLVGEEGARRPGRLRSWVIDPVDGTYNFLSRMPYWCSAVGLSDQEGPLVGAVYYPVVDELWLGGRDQPTTLNGVPVEPLADRRLGEIAVSTYFHPAHLADVQRQKSWRTVVSLAATVRMMGSASIDLASVAGGRLGLFLQVNLHDWDWLPGVALVRAAGGVAECVFVGDLRWHVAGNAQAVAEASAALLASG